MPREKDDLLKIFISHARQDDDFVHRLAKDLQKAGVDPWLDDRELASGELLSEKIRAAIDGADSLAVVVSKNFIDSDWVRQEAELAIKQQTGGKTKSVIPLLIDNVEMPSPFKGKLFADFRDSRKYEDNVSDLVRRLSTSDTHENDEPLRILFDPNRVTNKRVAEFLDLLSKFAGVELEISRSNPLPPNPLVHRKSA